MQPFSVPFVSSSNNCLNNKHSGMVLVVAGILLYATLVCQTANNAV
jgi:hypothetical protein